MEIVYFNTFLLAKFQCMCNLIFTVEVNHVCNREGYKKKSLNL